MKCLSLWQPWASLVVEGVKTVETRSWLPPVYMVGKRIAIHATMSTPVEIELELGALVRQHLGEGYEFPAGAVIGTVKIVEAWTIDTHTTATSGGMRFAENTEYPGPGMRVPIDPFGDFGIGRCVWLLAKPEKFDAPVPARGRQRLWDWSR